MYRELDRSHHFAQRTAFTIAMRVFRGGGLTKDAVYLRGLVKLLEYFRGGGEFERLLYGKIGFEHIAMIDELVWRKILIEAPLRPRHLEPPASRDRLTALRMSSSIMDLVKIRSKT